MKLFSPVFRVLTLAVCLVTAGSAFAMDPAYNIELNKGTLIKLKGPASAVMVADPEIADVQVVSPQTVYLNGRQVGETTILAVGENDAELLHAVVNVTHNLSKLNNAVKTLMPESDVGFDSIDGALVLKGSVRSPIEAENVRSLAAPFLQENQQLVNMVKTAGSNQVTLMVKVAEVSRTELKRFGLRLENLFNAGNFTFGLATGADIALDAAGNLLRGTSGNNNVYVGHRSGSANINGVIDALEQDGLVTVLAEPNLTAMSGQTANFLAGGEFPIPVVGDEGEVTIEYRPFGVSLGFTPTVLSRDRIALTVAPEVSTLSEIGSIQANGFNIPSLITRRAQTSVELGSGQTFAIAGLLQKNITNSIDKFPGLGDVPILGALFRSNEFRNDQTELVILVTPYVVNGVNAADMSTPLEGLQPPSDLERILFGKLYKDKPNAEDKEAVVQRAMLNNKRPRLRGPAGYMMP
jgi:pilus assembly protein CpaC